MLFRSCSAAVCSRRFRKSLTLLALVLTGFGTLSTNALALPSLTLDFPSGGPNGSVVVGDSVTVSIIANEIPAGSDGNGLFGFGFDLSFDPALVSASTPAAGVLWEFSGFSSTSSTVSSVGLSANRFFQVSGPSGSGILLGTVDLLATSVGLSPLNLSWYTGGPGDNTLFDGTALDAAASFFVSGSLDVTAVPKTPEPTSALLIALGLSALAMRSPRA